MTYIGKYIIRAPVAGLSYPLPDGMDENELERLSIHHPLRSRPNAQSQIVQHSTREDYQRISANPSYYGDFDPFGDFDLLFGAAHLNLKILEVPIRYRARRYSETNISCWRHRVFLVRMVIFAVQRNKFN